MQIDVLNFPRGSVHLFLCQCGNVEQGNEKRLRGMVPVAAVGLAPEDNVPHVGQSGQ